MLAHLRDGEALTRWWLAQPPTEREVKYASFLHVRADERTLTQTLQELHAQQARYNEHVAARERRLLQQLDAIAQDRVLPAIFIQRPAARRIL